MRCLVIRGDDEVLRFPVPEAAARLGSDPANDLVVPIAGVSRFHARLVPDANAPRLFDLDSKNGLLVKGKRYREVALLPGLVVQAGAARITLEDGATSDFDLAVEFPRPSNGLSSPPTDSAPITETMTSSPGSHDALRLLRDLERFGEEGRPKPKTDEFLERLRRVLGAKAVVLFRTTPSGHDLICVGGETPADSVLSALPSEGVEPGGIRFMDLEGASAAYRPPVDSGAHSALVLLPAGSTFAAWQREFLGFSLEHLTDAKSQVARDVAGSGPKRPRLVFPEGMVPGASPAIRGLLGQIAKTVHSRMDVLVLGETGTGKELIARMIHVSGPTPDGPFVAINCAAIPSELLESELFGVRARVATGVDAQPGRVLEANGGTLLLDEVGEMPLSLQPKILRFLQEREVHSVGASKPEKVDVRVISISNRDLLSEVKAGRFRSDLYYRLRGLQFHVPPLRDRKEDIAGLVTAIAAKAAADEGKVVRGITRKALDLLCEYSWPGNIRELQSEVKRAVLFCATGSPLSSDHFRTVEWAVRTRPAEAVTGRGAGESPPPAAVPALEPSLNMRKHVDDLERGLIEAALTKTAGNKSKAAELLGVTRTGLALKVRRLLKASEKRD